MKKILLIFIIIFGLYLPWVVNAEELKLDWQKNLGGTGQDLYNSIAFLSNGDLIAVGDYYSTDIEGIINNGKSDTIIVKYDKDGNVVWKKTQGGNMYDSFVEVTITKEDEIVIIGDSGSSNFFENKNGKDAIIAKYDKNGNVIWQKSWGTNGTRFTNVTMDDENIIALAIFHKACEGLQNNGNDDIAIIKYDKDGNVIWQKSWGGSGAEEFSAITIDGNKNIIIAGQTYSNDIDGIEKKVIMTL